MGTPPPVEETTIVKKLLVYGLLVVLAVLVAVASPGNPASADKSYQPKHARALSLMVGSVRAGNSKINSRINRLTTSLSRWLLWRRYCRVSSGFGHHLEGPELTVRIRERKL